MNQNQTYTVNWQISRDASSPREAAEKIWHDIFGRDEALPDDACVFEVIRPDGHTEHVDLGVHDED